jgi:FdhD protein
MPLGDVIIITSGRISSEILLKVARRGVPVLISKASPTDLGVILAKRLNMTLIRATPDGRVDIFAGAERVTE